MTNNILETLDVNVLSLGPIHIGTGEYIPPHSYIIKDKKIYRYDFIDFCSSLTKTDLNSLTQICRGSEADMTKKLYTFIKDKFNENTVKHTVSPFNVSDNVSDDVAIKQMFYDGGKPIIPGSSLKGAIRTALLQGMIDSKIMEAKYRLQGTNDPFKLLSISDITQKSNPIKIKYGVYDYYHKDTLNHGSKKNLSTIAEVISPHNLMKCTITLKNYLMQKNLKYSNEEKIAQHLQNLLCKDKNNVKTNLFNALNSHYKDLFYREIKPIQAYYGKGTHNSKFLKQIKEYVNGLEKNQYAVIKVGWHSGSMGVTYSKEYRKIRTSHGTKDEPSKLWYFSEKQQRTNKDMDVDSLYPCGWLLLI